jgi:hypothetical protein
MPKNSRFIKMEEQKLENLRRAVAQKNLSSIKKKRKDPSDESKKIINITHKKNDSRHGYNISILDDRNTNYI